MSHLYFAPASNHTPIDIPSTLKQTVERRWSPYDPSLEEWVPYENLKATVLSPICSTDSVGIPVRYDLVPIWGLTSTSIENYWDAIQPGDFIIFYSGNGNFPYIAKIGAKSVDEGLAETLWPYYELSVKRGTNVTGGIYSHILYLDTVWHAEIPTSWVKQIRDSEDVIIRRFSGVPVHRLNRLPKSPTEIVEATKSQIRSVAIERDRDMRSKINRAARQNAGDLELLSIACESNDIDVEQLSQSAKEDVIRCITEIYPEW